MIFLLILKEKSISSDVFTVDIFLFIIFLVKPTDIYEELDTQVIIRCYFLLVHRALPIRIITNELLHYWSNLRLIKRNVSSLIKTVNFTSAEYETR